MTLSPLWPTKYDNWTYVGDPSSLSQTKQTLVSRGSKEKACGGHYKNAYQRETLFS